MCKNLLDTYLEKNNLILLPLKGETEVKRDGMIFMPILLMDVMNTIYLSFIGRKKLIHNEKHISKIWDKEYIQYISSELRAFDYEQQLEMCDIMDSFSDYINNDIELFRVSVMNKFMNYDTDIRLVIAASLACNALTQAAHIIYKQQRNHNNRHLEMIERWSLKFVNAYADKRLDRTNHPIDLNQFKDIGLCCKKMCKSVIDFAKSLNF